MVLLVTTGIDRRFDIADIEGTTTFQSNRFRRARRLLDIGRGGHADFQKLGDRILEFLVTMDGAQLDALHQRIREFDSRFHRPIFP